MQSVLVIGNEPRPQYEIEGVIVEPVNGRRRRLGGGLERRLCGGFEASEGHHPGQRRSREGGSVFVRDGEQTCMCLCACVCVPRRSSGLTEMAAWLRSNFLCILKGCCYWWNKWCRDHIPKSLYFSTYTHPVFRSICACAVGGINFAHFRPLGLPFHSRIFRLLEKRNPEFNPPQ